MAATQLMQSGGSTDCGALRGHDHITQLLARAG
jgi:hypothetical protein